MCAPSGTARKNTVTISGGTVTGDVAGGDGTDEASENTVVYEGGTLAGNIVGGRGTLTNKNRIELRGGVHVAGTVTGGTAANGTGNTLAVYERGTEIQDLAGVQNLHFYLPEMITKDTAATGPMLKLATAANKDISHMEIGVGLKGDQKPLAKGDTVTLLELGGGTLTTAANLENAWDDKDVAARQGVSRNYKFLLKNKDNKLIAMVDTMGVDPQTKSLVETRVAASALINAGADLITDAGLYAASTAAARSGAGLDLWAAQSGANMRLHTGSYVDAKSYALNVGFAKRQKTAEGTLFFGPFVEYGRGSYDSYLDDSTRGNGAMHYIGAGIMGKLDMQGGSYIEASLRAGRIKSDYSGVLKSGGGSTQHVSYDASSSYYAAHVGAGHTFKLRDGDVLDAYAKVFYAHQGSVSAALSGTGDRYSFDSVNSSRVRLGARYTHKDAQANELYAGLAWEFEFGGKACASFDGMSTLSPSLRGGSALLELGYRFAPKSSRVSYGLNFAGWQGKREGISGGLNIAWGF